MAIEMHSFMAMTPTGRRLGFDPTFLLNRAAWFTPDTLPVIGFDVVDVQDTLFTLRALDQPGQGVAEAWLRAVQCAQLAHDRLLRDLRVVDLNLAFWQHRVSAGGPWSHGSFMLLSRGPRAFGADVLSVLHRLHRLLLAPLLRGQAPTNLQLHLILRGRPSSLPPVGSGGHAQAAERRLGVASGEGRAGDAAGAVPAKATAGGAGAGPEAGDVGDAGADAEEGASESATDMMQQRVLLLRALRSRLARAIAQLTDAAAGLRLGGVVTPKGRAAAGGMGTGASPAPAAATPLEAVEVAVRHAVRGMLAALEGLLYDTPGAVPSPASSVPGEPSDAPLSLSLELRRLLDVLRLQPPASVSSRLQPQLLPPPPPQQQHRHQQQQVGIGGGGSSSSTSGSGSGDDGGSGAGGGASAAGLHVVAGGKSARAALDAARRAAALSGPLVALPQSVRMPSKFQRYWLQYSAAAGLMLYGVVFLMRHSRLAGSNDLDGWLQNAAIACRAAFSTHVAEPLAAVRDELFRTFRDRPAIVCSQEFALSRESLLRMLADFAADQRGSPPGSLTAAASPSSTTQGGSKASLPSSSLTSSSSASSPSSSSGDGDGSGGGDEAVAAGMAVLMRSYEAELRHPLRNLVLGDLARALLIQVQSVKVDGEAAMLRLDQILRANELSISLLAALPAFAFTAAAVAGLARLVKPRAPDPRRAAVPSRMAMASLEVALEQLAGAEEQLAGAVAAASGTKGQAAAGGAAAAVAAERNGDGGGDKSGCAVAGGAADEAVAIVEELRGVVVYRLFQVYSAVSRLYRHADRTSRLSEWRPLHADLLRLAAPSPARQRLATHQRIMRTYTVFQR